MQKFKLERARSAPLQQSDAHSMPIISMLSLCVCVSNWYSRATLSFVSRQNLHKHSDRHTRSCVCMHIHQAASDSHLLLEDKSKQRPDTVCLMFAMLVSLQAAQCHTRVADCS